MKKEMRSRFRGWVRAVCAAGMMLAAATWFAGIQPPAGAIHDTPCEADLAEIHSGIEYPREEEYFPEYRYAVVRAPGGHSVYGYGSADHQGSSYTVPDGEEAIILAEREDYSCALVPAIGKGRWIKTEYLEPCWSVTGGRIYFNRETGRITACDDTVTDAVIPYRIGGAAVTGIENAAFSGCTQLQSVQIPDSVTAIGAEAFLGCTGLRTVEIPAGLSALPDRMFSGCSSLQTVRLPEAADRIGNEAFLGCTALQTVRIPERVDSIGYRAFAGCASLRDAVLPACAAAVGGECFRDCTGLRSVTLSRSMRELEDRLFCGCSNLTEVQLPEGVAVIGDRAFQNCTALKSVVIPDTVLSIGIEAFRGCASLSEILIPDSVTELEVNPFVDCSSLQTLTVSPDHPTLETVDGVLFGKTDRRLICYPCSLPAEEYTIPNGTRAVGEEAFAGCGRLKKVLFPDSVTTIGNLAFYQCRNLTALTLPDSVTTVGRDAFRDCENLQFYDYRLF